MDYQKVYLTKQVYFAFHKLSETMSPGKKQFLYASVLSFGDNIILKMSLIFLNALSNF